MFSVTCLVSRQLEHCYANVENKNLVRILSLLYKCFSYPDEEALLFRSPPNTIKETRRMYYEINIPRTGRFILFFKS